MGQVFGVKLHQKSMRTSRIDRCEPRYAGTEFTNRVVVTPMIHHPYMEIFRETSMTSSKIIQSGESLL